MFGATTTRPESPVFKHFKNSWQNIDMLKPFKVLQLPLKKGSLVRDDNKQCVTNTLALLGANSHTTSVHYKLGATHRARWMGGDCLLSKDVLMV